VIKGRTKMGASGNLFRDPLSQSSVNRSW